MRWCRSLLMVMSLVGAILTEATWTMAGPAGAAPRPDSGSTATYRNVLPGVDLRVTATYAGYVQLLVVHSRAAGLRLLTSNPSLAVTSAGLTVKSDGHGGLAAMTSRGKIAFTAPAPLMWDSGPANPQDGSTRRVPVGESLRGDRLYLRPSRSMLTANATRFPVMIDPSFSGAMLNWVDPLQLNPGELTWNGENIGTDPNGVIEMGKDPTFAARHHRDGHSRQFRPAQRELRLRRGRQPDQPA